MSSESSTSSLRRNIFDRFRSSSSPSSQESNESRSSTSRSPLRSAKYGQKVRLLGTGISAKVELFHNKSNDQYLAIKTFRPKESYESRDEYVKRCRYEFDIGKNLNHRNIIKTLSFNTSIISCQVALEFAPYPFLKMVQSMRPEKDEVLSYFKQLCQGVQYLHNKGIAHRDLKLENLVLDTDGRLKIIDFGTAVVLSPDSQLCTGVVGTEVLISPEALARVSYNGKANDIWALGIMLYCMLNLGFPWKAARESDKEFKAFRQDCTTIQEKYPQEIWNLVLQILKIDSEERVTIDNILLHPSLKDIHYDKVKYSRTLRFCAKRFGV